MASGFKNFHYHIAQSGGRSGLESLGSRSSAALESFGIESEVSAGAPEFSNDEAAARYYLRRLFIDESGLESLAALGKPQTVPELRQVAVEDHPLTNSRLVRFKQEKNNIPVFGSNVIVELDEGRNFISADADIADVAGVSPMAKLSPTQALWRIGQFTGKRKRLETVNAPELTFFFNENNGSWHLAYLFTKVSVSPPEFQEEPAAEELVGFGHGGPSPRFRAEFDYLVDAHDGSILLYFSSHPMLDVPVKCRGVDENGEVQIFWGQNLGSGFAMNDPLRNIKTFDLNFGNIELTDIPNLPVNSSDSNWTDTNQAAVSAHLNATRVYDFYKSELKRDSIDDKGMELISVVNCTYPKNQLPPEWSNAAWMNNRMWYGQVKDTNGRLRSYSRYLDIIAHELTHGVTETTADLVYKNQSGALNESFSDIFGVIIRNWYEKGANSDVADWNWTMGTGLGHNGDALRDMKDPVRLKFSEWFLGTGGTGFVSYPDHMDDYYVITRDSGGVHINSNIHNKAAYNLLTIGDDLGNRVFTPREVALFYYLTLVRIGRLANFCKTLQVLVDVASTYYSGDPVELQGKVSAIKRAYEAVGILMPE